MKLCIETGLIVGHAARGPLARPAARHFGPARPEAPGRAWAATVARGTTQARPDGPVLNDPVKNIDF